MNDYITKDQYECVWLSLSGIESTGTTNNSTDVSLHFPDDKECRRVLGDPQFTRFTNAFRTYKSIVRQAKLGEV